AGEVIERPASVVKELVENSLDAGADRIEIDIEEGGSRLIRVRDNGCGIHPEDMSLALASHATSKVRTASDLEAIRSLGFRGEALSSIASVSRFRLTSRMAGAERAWSLALSPGGETAEPVPAAHGTGTTVEVSDLFQAVPARRKFLRTERTEFLHILEMVKRLALCRFDLDIRLRHNRRRILHCRPAELDGERRIQDILGAAFAREAAFLDAQGGGMRLWGRLGGHGQTRNQSDRQYFYLNGRMIRDKRLNHAVRKALETSIPEGRYPSYVLHLEIDPAVIDVNVHPTKQEVRFRHARDVHDFIHAAVNETVQNRGGRGPQTALPGLDRGDASPSPAQGYPLREMAALYRNDRSASPASAAAAHIILGRFIVLPLAERLMILDTVEAKRVIIRDRLRRGLEGEGVTPRPLLVPVIMECTEDDTATLERRQALLADLGLELEAAGPVSLRIRSIPAVLNQADIQALCREMLAALGQDVDSDGLIDIMARHGSATAAAPESDDAVQQLLRSLNEAGIDPASGSQTGLFRCLDENDLAQLLRIHGD
ncbi:MAG: DNA mismatch repair endonuclease MutL, partial [Gammaproteobacteria bacterium]